MLVEQVLRLLADKEALVLEAGPEQVQQLVPLLVVQPQLLALLKCVSLRLRYRS